MPSSHMLFPIPVEVSRLDRSLRVWKCNSILKKDCALRSSKRFNGLVVVTSQEREQDIPCLGPYSNSESILLAKGL